MQIERDYFTNMRRFLKDELGVRSLLIGSNDHMYSQSGYPMVWSNSVLDIIDGHMYWQHPAHAAGHNTPMVNDPLHSMVVRLSRTALAGKPFTVSEVNHIFPGDWICEGVPISPPTRACRTGTRSSGTRLSLNRTPRGNHTWATPLISHLTLCDCPSLPRAPDVPARRRTASE